MEPIKGPPSEHDIEPNYSLMTFILLGLFLFWGSIFSWAFDFSIRYIIWPYAIANILLTFALLITGGFKRGN